MRGQISTTLWLAMFAEAKMHFGHPSEWNTWEVAKWMQERVRGIMGGEPAAPLRLVAKPYEPQGFPDAGRWDDVENL